MRKSNICFVGSLNVAKETAVESKIREIVDHMDKYFENIYLSTNTPLTFTDPRLTPYVQPIRIIGQNIPFIKKITSIFPFIPKKPRINIIDISFAYSSGFLPLISRLRHVPTVVNVLGGDIVVRKEFNYGLKKNLLRSTTVNSSLNHSTRICTLSKFMKKKIVERGIPAEKIELIPTGVDTSFFKIKHESNFRKQYRLTGNPVVMYLGSFIPIKGCLYLIKAARLIKDVYPDVKFVFMHFYTDQTYLKQCWELIDSLQLNDSIYYLGSVPHRYVADILSGCDVYLHTSFSESLGRSVLEAMACGKPVVASETGAIPEFVKPSKTGFLAKPGTPEDYAKKVIELLGDSTIRKEVGKRAREIVKAEYSLDVTAKKRLMMYKKLIS